MSLHTDYKDAITLINELEHKKRDRGIKLFMIITNNILKNPTKRKYKWLHHEKIYKKFGNSSDEFMFLILESGFELITKSTKILVFNNKNTALLKHIANILTNYQQLNQNSIINQIDNNIPCNKMQNPPQQNTSRNNWKQRHHDIDNIHCICGNILLQTTTTHIYEDTDLVLCDNCTMEIKPNDTIWHCTKGIDYMLHRYNYDLCCNCALKKLSNTNRCQQSKIHLRTFDAR